MALSNESKAPYQAGAIDLSIVGSIARIGQEA